ncbi:phosphoribosyltransferase family protein [uncultured Ruminococcus sp.]|uniref:ComF family protein n=1 Tax=uncultured Ruminococcus sp. TaxID=165186 RepID=UPI0025DD1180|nr:phosphoribosyltransferase family protein [uncultured Ruminococcus sp.]
MVSRRSSYKYLIDIILPNRCPVCSKVIKWDKLVCEKCIDTLPLAELNKSGAEECEMTYSAFVYKDKVKDLIYSLKYSGASGNFAEYSAMLTAGYMKIDGVADKIDIVTAVPMHISKKRLRGGDQAELLAKLTADILGKPADLHLLKRTRDKTEQHMLSARERKQHADMVYIKNPKHGRIDGKTVLICDDVITTGSTMNACARLLKEMGAAAVYGCSAAKTDHDE